MAESALAEVAKSEHLRVGVVHTVDHRVLVRGAATGLLDIILQRLMQAQKRVLLYTGHELVARALDGGMERDGKGELLRELGELANTGDNAAGRDRKVASADVETVGMPSRGKLAVCVSSQAGCGMRCAFCATGLAGLTRSLTAQEIVDQVLHVQRDFGERVTSVVFMGQGEPFANYDAVVEALRMLNSPDGLNIGARHLTVSTCGVIPGIREFAKLPEQFTLAISLHSAVQGTRNQLMPGVKKYTLLRLHEALQDYVEKTGRRPTYEYAMIDGVNDTNPEMLTLCDFCEGTLCHVNLIQLNYIPDSPFRPSPVEKVEKLQKMLASRGIEATIRNSRGSDIDAACGQLKQRIINAR